MIANKARHSDGFFVGASPSLHSRACWRRYGLYANMDTIYVKLLYEGTLVWRPVNASKNSNGTYTIAGSEEVPEEETWEFSPGQRVTCQYQTFSDGETKLVAYKAG